jgi:hypothetical protein
MRKRKKVGTIHAALQDATPHRNSYLLIIIPSRNNHEQKEFRKKEADAMASTDGSGECFRRWPYIFGEIGKMVW